MCIYKILDKCFKYNDDGTCLHHVLYNNIYSKPIIRKCRHTSDQKIIPVDGNTWVGISYDDHEKLRSKRPDIPDTPILTKRPIVYTRLFTFNKIIEEIIELVEADCVGVYIRNANTLETIEIIYDEKDKTTYRIRSLIYDSDPNDDDNMTRQLVNYLKKDEELVIVLSDNVEDDYIRKISDDQYMMVTIDK